MKNKENSKNISKGSSIKKWVIAIIVLLCVAAGAAFFLLSAESVNTFQVVPGDVDEIVSGNGTIEAENEITVYAPVSGKISRAIYKVGDSVTEKVVIASYDTTGFSEAYALAESNVQYYSHGYAAAKTQNDKAQTKYDTTSAGAQSYQAQYNAILSEMNQITEKSNSNALETQEDLQDLERDAANYETELADLRVDQGIVQTKLETVKGSIQEYDTQIKLTQSAINNLTESKKKYEAIQTRTPDEEAALAEIKADITTYESQLSVYKTQCAELVSQKNTLEAELDDIEDDISSVNTKIKRTADDIADLPADGMTAEDYARYTELQKELDLVDREWNQNLTDKSTASTMLINESALSQYSDAISTASIEKQKAQRELLLAEEGVTAGVEGIIIEKYVDNGQYVEAGQALYSIQPTFGYKAAVMVSKYDIGKIELGQSAQITVGSLRYTGKVSRIMQVSQVDASGKPKVKVEIQIDSSEDVPIIGLETEVTIFTQSAQDALFVPNEAVYSDDEGDYLYVIENGRVQKRYVTLQFAGESYTVLSDGVQSGDVVILDAMTDDKIGSRAK